MTEWTDKCQEAVGLLRLGLYLGKGKRVSPLMRRARGLLLGCCGLRRFGIALRCALVCVTVLNWANTVADEQNIAAIVMSRNRFMVQS